MTMNKFKREPFISLAILGVGFVIIYFIFKYDIHRETPPNLVTFSIWGLVLGFFLRNIFLIFFTKYKDTISKRARIYTCLFPLLGTILGVCLCYHIFSAVS